jgi:hypothetical protein
VTAAPAVSAPANPETGAAADQAEKTPDKPADKSAGGEVVRLDRFRKK